MSLASVCKPDMNGHRLAATRACGVSALQHGVVVDWMWHASTAPDWRL